MDTKVQSETATHVLTLIGPRLKKHGLALLLPGEGQEEHLANRLPEIAESGGLHELGLEFHRRYDLSEGQISNTLIPQNSESRLLLVFRFDGADDAERIIAEVWLVDDVRVDPFVPGVHWVSGGRMSVSDSRVPIPFLCYGISVRSDLSGFVPIGKDETWTASHDFRQLTLVS